MNLSPVLRQRYFDANGLPLAGGLLYSYAAGTSTPQGTYSNSTGTTNANPVVLDANGYADVWIDPSLAYKFILQDSGANVLWSVDNVSFPTGVSTWSINTSYSQGQLVADSSGQGLLYVSLTNANQGNALTSVANWRLFAGNIRALSVNTTLAITDDLVRANSTSGALTMTLPACSTTPIGKEITIKDVGTGGFATSLKGSGTDLVDGANTYASALRQNASAKVKNNGTSWDVISRGDTKSETASVVTASAHSGGFSANSTGTYTTPAGVKVLRVRMVGGGGGGGCSGNGNTTLTGAGGNSTFGTSLLTANGGSGGGNGGGGSTGGSGGPATVVTSATVVQIAAITGSSGTAGGQSATAGVSPAGGIGGGSVLGGQGAGAAPGGGTGGTPGADSGSGGGGAAGGSALNSGGGGGAGGYVEALIYPTAGQTFPYAVGAGGTAGASAGCNSGAAGASAQIIVEEFYQ